MINLTEIDNLRDLGWRLSSYNTINNLSNSYWMPTKLCVIVEAYAKEPLHQRDLQANYSLSASSISRTLKALETQGFIIRKRLEESTPALGIYLTDEGRAFAEYVLQEDE
jgi:DNA-binding HxlR family transcriptional regulator